MARLLCALRLQLMGATASAAHLVTPVSDPLA